MFIFSRLQNELMKLMMAGCKGVSAFPDGDNLFKWIGTIEGPENTVSKCKPLEYFPVKTQITENQQVPHCSNQMFRFRRNQAVIRFIESQYYPNCEDRPEPKV